MLKLLTTAAAAAALPASSYTQGASGGNKRRLIRRSVQIPAVRTTSRPPFWKDVVDRHEENGAEVRLHTQTEGTSHTHIFVNVFNNIIGCSINLFIAPFKIQTARYASAVAELLVKLYIRTLLAKNSRVLYPITAWLLIRDSRVSVEVVFAMLRRQVSDVVRRRYVVVIIEQLSSSLPRHVSHHVQPPRGSLVITTHHVIHASRLRRTGSGGFKPHPLKIIKFSSVS